MTSISAPRSSDKLDATVWKIAGVVVLGAIMSILDITVVNIAQPKFTEVFHTTQTTAAWTATGYTLALAAVIPLSGWASDRFGTKRLYMMALLLFTIGSVLCSLSWSIGSLIAFRVVQGLGGGMLMPVGMTILTRTAGPERVGRVMAVLGVPMLLGPIGGPILGGWLIQSASWHWIFLINVPIGVLALIYAAFTLPKDNPSPSESFDFLGMALLSPGLALFLFGVSSIPEAGTVAAGKVLIPGLIGLGLVVAFVLHAFRPEHPLLDLRLFKNRQLTFSIVSMFLFALAFFGAMLLLPYYFLLVRGEETLKAGLLLAPQGVGAMLTMPLGGFIADRFPVKRVVVPGLLLIVGGISVLTQLTPTTSYVLIGGALFVMGLGMGLTMMPLFTASLQTLRGHTIARGSTLMNITQQIASSAGVAVMSVVLLNAELTSPAAAQYLAFTQDPQHIPPPDQQTVGEALGHIASSQGSTFMLALILCAVTLIPVLLLPGRKHTSDSDALAEEAEGEAGNGPVPVVLH